MRSNRAPSANHGLHSYPMAARVGPSGRLLSIEPIPVLADALAEELEKRIQIDGIYFAPTYGNTLMGLATHKPFDPADNYAIIYYPPAPRAMTAAEKRGGCCSESACSISSSGTMPLPSPSIAASSRRNRRSAA